MIFAAGLGTRLNNETAALPKALVDVGGKPLLQHAIEKLKKSGITEIVVNVHHFAGLVIDFCAKTDFGIPIHISDESNQLLETGGGLKKASHFFTANEPVLVYNVDILSNLDLSHLLSNHLKTRALATLAVRNRETQRYFKFDDEMNLVGWVNKRTGESKISRPEKFGAATEIAFCGIQIVQPEIFSLMPAEDRFSITDLYLELAKTHTIKGVSDNSDLWIDVGKPEQLEEARRIYNHKRL